MEPNYLTKAEYLHSRILWKTTYVALAKEIKDYKIAARECAKGGYEAARRFQSMKDKMGNYAHTMMDDLDFLKASARLSVAFEKFRKTQNAV